MTGIIKNEYRVTWKMFGSWLLENKMKPPKLFFTIMWTIFGLVVIGMAVAFRFAAYYVIALLFLCFYRMLFRDILVARRQYAAMAKSYGQRDWLRTITFEEGQITLLEGNISVNYMYSDLSEIKEKDNKVWLILKDDKVIRMYKDCFVNADWEKCRSLIEEKRSA